MTERKYTDEEIIKAYAICEKSESCLGCPYYKKDLESSCVKDMKYDVLALLNRQKAEIERLKRALNTDFSFVRTRCSGKTKRINEIITFRVETIKAEAIKEFAERLLNEYATMSLNSQISIDVVGCDIKRIVKEMVGELNDT